MGQRVASHQSTSQQFGGMLTSLPPPSTLRDDETTKRSGGDKPVLVVDDERDFREGIQKLLESSGFEVYTAINGQDALEVLTTIPRPGIILLDLMMPVMNGHQLIKALHADPRYADIPLVAVTAAPVSLRGVSAFLHKPPDLDELLAVVEHACRHNRSGD